MRGSKTLFTTRNGFMGGIVATTKRFMGAPFYRWQLEPPWHLITAEPTERSSDRGSRLLMEAREKTYTPCNIKRAFEAIGIWPLNERRVLDQRRSETRVPVRTPVGCFCFGKAG